MKKLWRIIGPIVGICAMVSYVCLCWTAAYFIANSIYRRVDWHPHDLIGELVICMLGFLLFGFTMAMIGRFGPFRKKQMAFMRSITDAMKQIARGDFNVDLRSLTGREHGGNPFGEIIDNIHYMATELKQIEQMRQEFVSNVSHEIQSPLTSINGFIQALQNDRLEPEQRRHYLDIIETESRRLSKLSDNLLKLSSLESEQHPFEKKSYRLDKQLRHIVLSCEPQWVEKELEMDVCLEKAMIMADEELMSQVWMNLLGNAIKFTPRGGTIGVHLDARDGEAVVRISDTGIGLSEEERLHVFERFYKADKSRNRAAGGSGLGLSIVKKIVDMHQGGIEVQSVKGEGTTVTVVLPSALGIDSPGTAGRGGGEV